MIDQEGKTVAVMARGLGLDRRRVPQIQAAERHVHGMAGDVAQGPGAEIPPAPPGKRMIDRAALGRPNSSELAERPLRRGTQPEIPVQLLRAAARARAGRDPAARWDDWSRYGLR